MGMFDRIYNVPLFCPRCGTSLAEEEWQTKDLGLTLTAYELGDMMTPEKDEYGRDPLHGNEYHEFDIYTSCPKCNLWVEFVGYAIERRFVGVQFGAQYRGGILDIKEQKEG